MFTGVGGFMAVYIWWLVSCIRSLSHSHTSPSSSRPATPSRLPSGPRLCVRWSFGSAHTRSQDGLCARSLDGLRARLPAAACSPAPASWSGSCARFLTTAREFFCWVDGIEHFCSSVNSMFSTYIQEGYLKRMKG